MATTGKEYQQELEELAKRESHLRARTATLAAEEAETRKALEAGSEEKRSKLGNALDAMKKRYFQRLLRGRGVKVLAPRLVGVEERTLGKVTTIPKIVQRNLNEIEIQPAQKNYSYVRILYDTFANQYFYEVIEPKLLEEEAEVLEVLKEILVESLELLEDAAPAAKERYLRRDDDRHAGRGHFMRRRQHPLLHLPSEVRKHPEQSQVRHRRGARLVRRLARPEVREAHLRRPAGARRARAGRDPAPGA